MCGSSRSTDPAQTGRPPEPPGCQCGKSKPQQVQPSESSVTVDLRSDVPLGLRTPPKHGRTTGTLQSDYGIGVPAQKLPAHRCDIEQSSRE